MSDVIILIQALDDSQHVSRHANVLKVLPEFIPRNCVKVRACLKSVKVTSNRGEELGFLTCAACLMCLKINIGCNVFWAG
eukprot:827401-Pelagomonas_calceolata.AAC.1